LFSFPRGTEMFQFPRFPLPALCVQAGVTPHDGCGVSPFGHPRIEAWSAAPRGFSQPPTSFIGIRRQGIHRWLFVAWRIKDARARYGILKGHAARQRTPPAGGQRGREWVTTAEEARSLKTEQKKSGRLRSRPGGQVLRQATHIGSRVVRASTGNLPTGMADKDSLERR
jgi:hypothetical protein